MEDQEKNQNPEEELIAELRRAYVEDGVLEARSPKDKANQKATTFDSSLRSHHLAIESQVQQYLTQVTTKMAGAQKMQGMIYLSREISELLEGNDKSFGPNVSRLYQLVQKLNDQVEIQKSSASTSLAKSLNASVSSMSEANTAMFEVQTLEQIHTTVKGLLQVIQDYAPRPTVH